ncbi:MAG: FmdB family zinc ribbon protein [Chloroflexota bacterium]
MPIYDYKCGSCGHGFECKQGFDSEPFADCPRCGMMAHRQLHAAPVIFRGSGFYITDNRKGSDVEAKMEKAESKKEDKADKAESKKEERTEKAASKKD